MASTRLSCVGLVKLKGLMMDRCVYHATYDAGPWLRGVALHSQGSRQAA